MDRAIFDLQASIEATSLYILLCALADEGEPVTLERASLQWNGTRQQLLEAAGELRQRGVLVGGEAFTGKNPLQVKPSHEWR